MLEPLFSNKVELRFTDDGMSVYVYAPYNKDFISDLKAAFNADCIGDKGAEWDSVLKCWIVHTGWTGCEDWLDKLICLLNKYYPE